MDYSSPWTVPRDAGTALFSCCHFTGLAGEALPAAGVARLAVLHHPGGTAIPGCVLHPRCYCHNWLWPASLGVPQALRITEHLKGQNQP